MRHESAALKHWRGVSTNAVWAWRKALGVDRTENEGSQRLIRAASEAGAAELRGKTLSADAVEERRQRAKAMDLIRFLRSQPARRSWTEAELQLLGTMPDAKLAKRLRRTALAVRLMRTRRGIALDRDRRRKKFRN